MKKRMQQRSCGSPLVQQSMAKEKDTIDMTREAVEKAASKTGGAYTPPIPRKTPEKEQGRERSGSTGEDNVKIKEMAQSHSKKNPALDRVKIKNEASGQ